MDNFIEHKNFLRIYFYNKTYKQEHRRHTRALFFQLVILAVVIFIALINNQLDSNFINDMYLDQYNRIYALLVALLTAILIGLTPIDRQGKLNEPQYEYTKVTYKQDYVSILMYTLALYMVGIFSNIVYAVFLQYFNLPIIDFSFWIVHVFILLDALFFTLYSVDELADIVKFIK